MPLLLIAEREFRTYVATLSFWAALAVGPLAAGGGLFLEESLHRPTQLASVEVMSPDARTLKEAETALKEAALLDGRHLRFGQGGSRLTISAPRSDMIALDFAAGFPLSPLGRALVARSLERDAARDSTDGPALTAREASRTEPSHRPGPAAAARFLMMAMLWLTLTGSLGMLLQTVVRERASRSLESLLAAASPWQIMAGKLLGVGGVSLLVLGAWIGSSVALAFFMPQTGVAPPILAELTRPVFLARAAVIYCLAYALYGSVTVALGGLARDSASAQNLARPMFILLMAAFFVALALAVNSVSAPPSWLLYLPAFTPFVLLIYPAGTLSLGAQVGSFALMATATFIMAWFAASQFALRENGAKFVSRLR